MNDAPTVSVVVVSWNTCDLLRQCLASVERHLRLPHELLVVDNASSDGSAEMVAAEFPAAKLLRQNENLGFGRANNLAMRAARGAVFLLLNSDAYLADDGLGALALRLAGEPATGVIGPLLLEADGRLQPSAYRFVRVGLLALEELALYKLWPRKRRGELLLGGYWNHAEEREVDWVVGACMLVRRDAFERTSGFDPAIFMYGEEEEWCERIRTAGWRIVFAPAARVVHLAHRSSDKLFGEQRRLVQCLRASEQLVRRRDGWLGRRLVTPVRVLGALVRLTYFGLRRLWRGRDDAQGATARATARVVLRHSCGLGVRAA